MAANTVSVWTESRVGYGGNSLYKASCTVLSAVANSQIATNKTPIGLDINKPWSLIMHSTATIDAGQTPVLELWGGYANDFAMTNTTGLAATAATSGVKIMDLCDDLTLCVTARPFIFTFQPASSLYVGSVADVVTVAAIATGFKAKIPVMPYYAFGVQCDTTVDAVTTTFLIIQAKG